jgi:hypothetical protein
MLLGSLQYQRGSVLKIVGGLPGEAWQTPVVPSGWFAAGGLVAASAGRGGGPWLGVTRTCWGGLAGCWRRRWAARYGPVAACPAIWAVWVVPPLPRAGRVAPP